MSTTTIIIHLSLPPSALNLEDLKSPATVAWTDALKSIVNSDTESKPTAPSVCAHDSNGDVLLVIRNGNEVSSNSALPTLLRPLLPYLTAPVRVFTAESQSVYAPPQRTITAVTVFLPWSFATDMLKVLWDVIYMGAEKERRVAGMRFGGVKVLSGGHVLGVGTGEGEDGKESEEVDGDDGLMYKGEKCKIWMIWWEWTSDEGKRSLEELVDFEKMGAVGWEEREWRFEKVEDMIKELGGGSCCIM
ncbi:hypothetical protein ACMFMG_003041 [Clarireedia jacksonii]